ncbi:putative dipeptidase [Delphinella strobiligena]|nr:putative dipeptidase [Delphinella strobiligena]
MQRKYLVEVLRYRGASVCCDGHNDLMILLRYYQGNHIYTPDFKDKFENGGMTGHVDLPRLDAGRVGGAFWSAFVPCPANGSDFSDETYAPFVKATLEQLDLFARLRDLYPKYFTPPPNAFAAAHHFRTKQLISPLGIEGLHQIGNSLSTLRLYHTLGVRYGTLTWNCHNRYADAALVSNDKGETVVAEPLWNGVSAEGRALIGEMNRLGMMVDLSHGSVNTMRDVLGAGSHSKTWKGSLAPPIFSHSSAYAICPHPRNVPDDVLQLLKQKRGLVMVNFNPDFISCKPSNASSGLPEFVNETSTLLQVVKHITYIGDLIGYDHVGIGTDYDGIPTTPRGLEDVSKFPDLVAALLDAGVSEHDAGKVVGNNLLRVWGEVDAVAAELKRRGIRPLEDEVKLSEVHHSEI